MIKNIMIKEIQYASATQARVVFALMMREVHTIYGKTKLRYLWVIIQTAFAVCFMWGFRILCHIAAPHGMSVLLFLVVGFAMWNIFAGGVLKCITAVDANKALLTFPQVLPIDIMIARCIVVLYTEIISAIIIIFIGYCLGYDFCISNIGGLIYSLIIMFVLSLGFGMIFASINSYFHFIERILPLVFRILMFASGAVFSITPFTGRIGDWILWNPFLQIIEYARTCVSSGYPAYFVSHGYIIFLTLYTFTIGMLLEMFTRKRSMS